MQDGQAVSNMLVAFERTLDSEDPQWIWKAEDYIMEEVATQQDIDCMVAWLHQHNIDEMAIERIEHKLSFLKEAVVVGTALQT